MKKTHKAHLKAEKAAARKEGYDVDYTRYETSPGVWRHDIFYQGKMVAREIPCREAYFILANRDFKVLEAVETECAGCEDLARKLEEAKKEKETIMYSLDDSRHTYDLLHGRLEDTEAQLRGCQMANQVVRQALREVDEFGSKPGANTAITTKAVRVHAADALENTAPPERYDLAAHWLRRTLRAAEMRQITLTPQETRFATGLIELHTINGTGFLRRLVTGEGDGIAWARIIANTNWLCMEGYVPA